MREKQMRDQTLREMNRNGGLLPMKPCWVARDFLPPGRRLGLSAAEYSAGERGFICERCKHEWIGRLPGDPVVCPQCKSPYWNRPRQETKKRAS